MYELRNCSGPDFGDTVPLYQSQKKKHDTHSLHWQKSGVRTPLLRGRTECFCCLDRPKISQFCSKLKLSNTLKTKYSPRQWSTGACNCHILKILDKTLKSRPWFVMKQWLICFLPRSYELFGIFHLCRWSRLWVIWTIDISALSSISKNKQIVFSPSSDEGLANARNVSFLSLSRWQFNLYQLVWWNPIFLISVRCLMLLYPSLNKSLHRCRMHLRAILTKT